MTDEKKYTATDKWFNDALKAEPGYFLPDNFAEKVVGRVSKKIMWKTYVKEFLIYLCTIVGVLAVYVATVLIWFQADSGKWIDLLVSNLSWVVGVNFVVVFILFTDRVLLRYFLFRKNSAV